MALVTIPVVALALAWFLKRTIWGIAITAAAANPDAARLAGLSSHVLVRRLPWAAGLLALVAAVVIPIAINTNARYFLYSRMALIAIVVVSVTILTGWAGQLSLAQFALAGLGAMTMAGADL